MEVVSGLGPCELWDRRLDTGGYGVFIKDGKTVRAHREAWIEAYGPIPDGLCVLHRCDRPACVKLAHLFLGTQRDNAADRDQKGRQARGAANGRARLNESQVVEILSLRGRFTSRELAKLYGVSRHTVLDLLSGQTWKHIPRPGSTGESRPFGWYGTGTATLEVNHG